MSHFPQIRKIEELLAPMIQALSLGRGQARITLSLSNDQYETYYAEYKKGMGEVGLRPVEESQFTVLLDSVLITVKNDDFPRWMLHPNN